MQIGPLAPSVIAQSPLKPLAVAVAAKTRHIVVFDATHPHNISSDVLGFTAEVACFGKDANGSRAAIGALVELGQNTEWHRCGLFVTCREDGVTDAQDGFYVIEDVQVTEESQTVGWANAKVAFAQRGRQPASLGVWSDSKAQQDDYIHGGGVALVAYPQGLDQTNAYPPATYTFASSTGGTVGVVENPAVSMRAPLLNPVTAMTQGRCGVTDESVNGAVSTEVFWRDHRLQNAVYRFTNTLFRYTLTPGGNAPLIEAWFSGAWVTVGSLQLQSYNGSTYSILPVQGVTLAKISPDEVEWEERRYDATGSALVVVKNRIRRGSRLLECQIVAASGLGLTGPQSVSLTAAGTWVQAVAADTSGVVWTQASNNAVPGFAYLTKAANAATQASGFMYSGLSVPAGTVARVGIAAGVQDAQYTALGTAALYAAKLAAYNRQRVRQRMLIQG